MKTDYIKTKFFIICTSLIVGGLIGYLLHSSLFSMKHEKKEMHPNDMYDMMMDMTARMEGQEGDELDRIFLEDMIVHHQGAVDMAILLADKTQRPELKAFAQEIIEVQDKEINMMKGWLEVWFSHDDQTNHLH